MKLLDELIDGESVIVCPREALAGVSPSFVSIPVFALILPSQGPRYDVLAKPLSGLSGTNVAMTGFTLTMYTDGGVTLLRKTWSGRL